MFGIGFALLMQRIGQSGGRRWYLRRLAVLFLIGLLHSAFWWGDILRSYAVAGLLLLPLARMRPRNLAILGVALMYLPHLPWWQGDSSLAPRAHAYAAALVAFSSEHAATMLRGNHAFDLWWWQSHWRVPASLPGLMLIGLALGNSQVLRDPDRHAGFWKWLLACLPVGLVLALLATLSDYGRLGRFGDATAPWRHALDQGIVLLVALGYAPLFVFLFSRARWHQIAGTGLPCPPHGGGSGAGQQPGGARSRPACRVLEMAAGMPAGRARAGAAGNAVGLRQAGPVRRRHGAVAACTGPGHRAVGRARLCRAVRVPVLPCPLASLVAAPRAGGTHGAEQLPRPYRGRHRGVLRHRTGNRSEEHTSELQSLMRIS